MGYGDMESIFAGVFGLWIQQDRASGDWCHLAIGTQNGGRSYFIGAWCSCFFAYRYCGAILGYCHFVLLYQWNFKHAALRGVQY
jgi:hypothetical protein